MKKLKYEKLLFPEDRPICPRCGSTHVISRGIEWGCAECGRRWVKKKNFGKNWKSQDEEKKQCKDSVENVKEN